MVCRGHSSLVDHQQGIHADMVLNPLNFIEFDNRKDLIQSLQFLRELKDYDVLKINYYC